MLFQTAVQDTLNEAEGAQPVFHPRQNSFEGSDEEDNGSDDNAIAQNQVPARTDFTGTPTVTTVARRPNQVSCASTLILYQADDQMTSFT